MIKGVDVYFDNVAEHVLDVALNHINMFARIALVGAMSQYNAVTPSPGPDLWRVLEKRATVQGPGWAEHPHRAGEFYNDVGRWLKEGRIRYREDIAVGLENAPAAFVGVMEGKNLGKALVKVSEDPTGGRR